MLRKYKNTHLKKGLWLCFYITYIRKYYQKIYVRRVFGIKGWTKKLNQLQK